MSDGTDPKPPRSKYTMDVAAAAEYLELSVDSIYRLVQGKKIPHARKGQVKGIVFSHAELEEWIRSNGVKLEDMERRP